jgi:hypothetical protein
MMDMQIPDDLACRSKQREEVITRQPMHQQATRTFWGGGRRKCEFHFLIFVIDRFEFDYIENLCR